MEKVTALPSQIILLIDSLKSALRAAAAAQNIDAARESLSGAEKLADQINDLACNAAAEVGT